MFASSLAAVRYIRSALAAGIEGETSSEPFLSVGKIRRNLRLAVELRRIRNRFGKLDYVGLSSPWIRDVELFADNLRSVFVYEIHLHFVPVMVANLHSVFGWQDVRYSIKDICEDLRSGNVLTAGSCDFNSPWIINLDFCADVPADLVVDVAFSVRERVALQSAPTAGIVAITFRCADHDFPAHLLRDLIACLSGAGVDVAAAKSSSYRGNLSELMGHIWVRVDAAGLAAPSSSRWPGMSGHR
ncbi:hypothetical protein [Nocardia vinacea]|uniref:hypothetical protein n=1 Tax=Nocardia vinacea TaxID=96468 RepID=UPI0012F6FBC8|nr:hypothetical protein [Nocardia vinacea]